MNDTVDQWAVYELRLTAYTDLPDQDAYTDVVVTATFTGPNRLTKMVAGFWDGGTTWRIRFTPTLSGQWNFQTRSNLNDSGLARSGTLTVRAASVESRGFLRRDPANRQSFVFDNGSRFFMIGQTYYEIARAARADQQADAPWQTAIIQSKCYGITKVRLLVHPWGGNSVYYPDVAPFLNNNHDVLDLTYWQALDRVVDYLHTQGLIADLILFTDTPQAFGTQEQDDRYIRYIIARYAAYPNVIWCLSNEWEYTDKAPAYWDRVGKIVRAEDPWIAQGDALRPLSIHNKTGGPQGGRFAFFRSSWPTHVIIQYGTRNQQFRYGDQWGNYSITCNAGHAMPVVNDEYGYLGETNYDQTAHRNALWGITTGGGYGSVGDGRPFPDGPNGDAGVPYLTSIWHDAPEYADIQRYVTFWTTRGIPYWRMTSQNKFVAKGARVYVLGLTGKEYVVYAAAGGRLRVNLPKGHTYTVTRYNPRAGDSAALPNITGPTTWTMPDAQDWVLHIKAS